MSEADKLKPDFIGRWEGVQPSDFKLYVLDRHPFLLRLNLSNPANYADLISPKEGEEYIEGFITDNIGVSVFSGFLGKGSVRFLKRYSELAVRRGAYPEIYYEASADEEGKYTGTYTLVDTEVSNQFTLLPN